MATYWSKTVIVKIHSRGAGSGSGPVDYLLGKDRQREQASVLRGNPEHVRELIDGCDFARAYTSGVLSFQEPDIADAEKSRLMDEWEHTLLTGLDCDQYACLWVEHRDKGRLELNFVIPNIELQSGKRLQPYFDRADRPRVNARQTLTNDRLGLRDPERPDLSPPADAGQRSSPRQTAGGRKNHRRPDEPDAAGRDPAAGRTW
uniref:relaxase/mobilization nuclease domain-containing protein n=1 Tax=Klebsiella pneumoniae TaxID=573 RepID=UPI002484DE6E|nr:relaxase/mobilization nuclease domain-containing protein [Klebsiella pneumoniae]WGU84323.1 relaxase/mobilization nuclease domain-containing protein [Klebsiella pneumoniae]